jgi:hypothetical protein
MPDSRIAASVYFPRGTFSRRSIARAVLTLAETTGEWSTQAWFWRKWDVHTIQTWANEQTRTGGPLKPGFGLSGDVHTSQTWASEQTRLSSCHGDSRVFSRVAKVISSHSAVTIAVDPHCRSQTTAGPSTPQIIAFAMICSGRDDKVGRVAHSSPVLA